MYEESRNLINFLDSFDRSPAGLPHCPAYQLHPAQECLVKNALCSLAVLAGMPSAVNERSLGDGAALPLSCCEETGILQQRTHGPSSQIRPDCCMRAAQPLPEQGMPHERTSLALEYVGWLAPGLQGRQLLAGTAVIPPPAARTA